MDRKVLAVARPEWQAALRAAATNLPSSPSIDGQEPAEAVTALATRPIAYHAVAIEEEAAGPWFDTLLDLTLGDTDRPIPLLMLGQPAAQNRLNGTPVLNHPVTQLQLQTGLKQAAINSAQHVAPPLPENFSDLDSIRIRYQPMIRLADLRPTAVEILARVQTETGALVGPQAIIAAMINGYYAMSLSRLIVQRALRERNEARFNKLGLAFAFNLPLDAMLDPSLLSAVNELQQEQQISPRSLRFELTETKPVNDLPAITRVIETLLAAGYKVALDDITPYTPNLDKLLELPFRAVKLDRGVVTGAISANPATAARNRAFIEKITRQAQTTGRAIIAEGIESLAAQTLMEALGATHGQGYLFARPLPANALQPWLTHWLKKRGT